MLEHIFNKKSSHKENVVMDVCRLQFSNKPITNSELFDLNLYGVLHVEKDIEKKITNVFIRDVIIENELQGASLDKFLNTNEYPYIGVSTIAYESENMQATQDIIYTSKNASAYREGINKYFFEFSYSDMEESESLYVIERNK